MLAVTALLAAGVGANAALSRPLPKGAELLTRFGAAPQEQAAPQAPAATGRAVSAPLITDALWTTLPAPSAAEAAQVQTAFPWVHPESMRELTPAAADSVVGEAAAQGRSPLDLFTDPGLRTGAIYLIKGETLQALARKYAIPSALMIAGKDKGGRAFAMQFIVMGQYHADVSYGRDFEYDNPWFPDYSYLMKAKISETIRGDGAIDIDGVRVDAGLFKPVIHKFVKVSPTQVRVETSMGSRTRPLAPITRR